LTEIAISHASKRAIQSTSIRGAATAYVDPLYTAQILRSMLRLAASLRATTVAVDIGFDESSAFVTVVDDGPRWSAEVVSALQLCDRNQHSEPLGHSIGTAAELAHLMDGELTYERDTEANRLSLRVPVADASLRGADFITEAARLNEDRLSVTEIQQVVETGPERIFFQPIVDLSDPSTVVGFEALSRFGQGSPSKWFAAAGRAGLQLDLELACIKKAVWSARDVAEGFVAINLSSGLLTSDELFDSLLDIDPKRVVLELSENSQIDRYETTSEDIAMLTQLGFRFALDDVGNSEIDLWRIVRLRPSIVKLDLSLARGIHCDPDRRAVASAMIAVAHAIDAIVIAEGIETPTDLDTMIELGADLGQGFLFDRTGGPVRNQ
jgi:EAL domain-containing protein (putative c-di-GMP-specific phosphodiesterase class I)